MQGTESTRWWQALELREEILDAAGRPDDVQVSLYQVVYEQGANKPQYANADYYGKITQPTSQLVDLLARIAIRLGGGAKYEQGVPLTRLDQGMGGGKSHACIGAWHLAKYPAALAAQDIGRQVFERAEAALGQKLPKDLSRPQVVVLSCDNMTPGSTDPAQDGQWAYNLYERFLWRLFDGLDDQRDRYESFKPHFGSKAKIGEAIRSLNRPVLIIIDEILNYIGDGLEGKGDEQLAAQDMTFLRALTETVTSVPHVSMIVVMIDSEKDTTTLRGGGEARRADFESYLQRQGPVATSVNENADFSAILRRRLFDRPASEASVGAAAAQAADALQQVMDQDVWKSRVFGVLGAVWTSRFAGEVARTFPFHPQLMKLAEDEWASLAGFQQVRSTIMIFAAAAYALAERAKRGEWVPVLIGPGDLPLSDARVRDAVIGSGLIKDSKTQGNYRSIAQSDIVNLEDNDGTARRLDLVQTTASWKASNPRASERAATMIFLTSIVGTRGGSRRGAADPEVKAATVVPDLAYSYVEADTVVRTLTNADDNGLATVDIFDGTGGRPRRYYLNTQQRLPMLVRAMRNTVTDGERDGAIADRIKNLLAPGPFAKARFLRAEPDGSHRQLLIGAGLDEARTTRLIALDPAMFTMGNGTEQPTVDSVQAVLGLGTDPVPAGWMSSLVFIVASARGKKLARQMAAEYVACTKVLTGPEVAEDPEVAEQANRQLGDARDRLDDHIQRAFQHVLYLSQPDPSMDRKLEPRILDQGTLSGARVWEELATQQKAFRPGAFDATALLHNLRDSDYQRPLSELRDAFWNTTRLSLLPGDGSDLRQAIFDAVQNEQLEIIRAGDEPVVVTDPAGINFNAPTYRLAKPKPLVEQKHTPGDSATGGERYRHGGDGRTKEANSGVGARTPSGDGGESSEAEQILALTVMKNLVSESEAADKFAQLFRRLFDLLDRESISYLNLSLQAQLASSQAKELADLIESLEFPFTIRDR